MENKEGKKSGIKVLIIVLVILVLAIVGGIGGFFVYKIVNENKSVGTEWGDIYFEYLTEAKNTDSETRKQNYGIDEQAEKVTIQFSQVDEDEKPEMIMNYTKENDNYTVLYYINQEQKVNYIKSDKPAEVEILYNIEQEKYASYLHTEEDNKQIYQDLEKILEEETTEVEAEYTFTEEEMTSKLEVEEGEVPVLSKYDQTFIKPEIEENKKIDFDINAEEKELKAEITGAVTDYKEESTIITEEVKQETENKVEEIENKKEEIKEIEEKIREQEEAKKKEEEERKKAEEAAKGLKVGNYRLKYGTYTSDVAKMDSSMYGTITLNQDGTFHIKANCEGYDYPYPKLDCDGTYKVGKVLNSFEYFDGIHFTTSTGVQFSFEVFKNNAFSDQWHGYTYAGN